jgi:hypothetical protein
MLEKVRMSTLTMLRFHSRHPIWEQNIPINSGQRFQPKVTAANHKKKNQLNLKTSVFWDVGLLNLQRFRRSVLPPSSREDRKPKK